MTLRRVKKMKGTKGDEINKKITEDSPITSIPDSRQTTRRKYTLPKTAQGSNTYINTYFQGVIGRGRNDGRAAKRERK